MRAMADDFVGHDQRADDADEAERRESRYSRCGRDQREQDNRTGSPPPEDATRRSEEERDVPEQVERGAATEPHRGHRVELVADVAKGRLEAESEEHDAGDHR